MKKIYITFFALTFLISAYSQQTETIRDANAQERKASGFHAIQIEDGIDLYLTEGKEESLAISASKEFQPKVISVVENGVLRIYFDGERIGNWKNRNLKAYISFKQLDKINASGGADVVVKGSIESKTLSMNLSGGSDFIGKVVVEDLNIVQSGGSDVRISGTAGNVKIHASGGSDFKGYELSSSIADFQASGGSDAEITVSKELSVEASGGSDVHYKGDAIIRRTSSSGGSGVSKRG